MRTAVVTEMGEWSASTRYRASQHLGRLRTRLGPVDLLLPDDQPLRRPGRVGQVRYFSAHAWRYGRRWRDLRRVLEGYDALLIQRGFYPMGPGIVAGVLDDFAGRVVYDVDDALWDVKPALEQRGRATHWLYGSAQAKRTLARADAVVVSTEVLADSIGCGVPIVVLPTVPDPADYVRSDLATAAPAVVWAGTAGGLPYLDPLREVFAKLSRRQLGELTVVCSAPWSGPSSFRAWRREEEHAVFAQFSVGIMPLPDTAYTRAKAGFKMLQYMAAGLPVVASPVGVNVRLVEESGGGLLADAPNQWEDALAELLGSRTRRTQLGAQGRAFVEGYADLEGQADVLAALLSGDEPSHAESRAPGSPSSRALGESTA